MSNKPTPTLYEVLFRAKLGGSPFRLMFERPSGQRRLACDGSHTFVIFRSTWAKDYRAA